MAAETKRSGAQKQFIKYKLPEKIGLFASADDIKAYCKKHDIDPTKAVFLFPGHVLAHHDNQKGYHNKPLYSSKSGGGLASISGAWNKKGYPSLSLPSVKMDPTSAEASIEDAWRAVGAGFRLILPTKTFNGVIFDTRFSDEGDTPAWWGGIEPIPPTTRFSAALSFPQYYQEELQRLERCCNATPQQQAALLADLPENFKRAYEEGSAQKNTASPSPWYAPISQATTATASQARSTTTAITTDERKETKSRAITSPSAKRVFTKFKLPGGATTATAQDLTDHCERLGLDPAKTVFIFPGERALHHAGQNMDGVDPGRNKALYRSSIAGEGLAKLADQWAREERPCLSVPTVDTSEHLAKANINDVWRAVGAGFSFMLPTQGENHNPIGWGEAHVTIQKDRQNLIGGATISEYYLREFQRLEEFCNASFAEQQRILPTLPLDFQMSYSAGKNAGSSKWYAPLRSLSATTTHPKAAESTPLLNQHAAPASDASTSHPIVKRLANKAQWALLALVSICVGGLVAVAIVPTAIVAINLQILLPIAATLVAGFGLWLMKNASYKPQTKLKLAIVGAVLFAGLATFVGLLFFGQVVEAIKTFNFHHLDALYALPLPIASIIVGIATVLVVKDLKQAFAGSEYTPLNPVASQEGSYGAFNADAANRGGLSVPNNYRSTQPTANNSQLPSSSWGGRATSSNNEPRDKLAAVIHPTHAPKS